MSRLPIPGQDDGAWGEILNAFMLTAHKSDGTIKDGLITSASLNGGVGSNGQVLTKDDTTAGGMKWTSTSMAGTNLSSSVDGTQLSIFSDTGTDITVASATTSNAGVMSAADKTKLNGIAAGAQVNTVTSVASRTGDVVLAKSDVGLGNVDNTSDANKPVSTAQAAANTADRARSNHSGTQAANTITGLATVATTGAYNDLSGKPTIPSAPGDIGALATANNLSELTATASTARTNLGLGSISTLAAPVGTVVGTTDTQTLSNKQLIPRVSAITSSATPTPTADASDEYVVTALAVGASFQAPSGTPQSGQRLILRLKDDGTARSLAWNAIYRAHSLTLPTTTVASKTMYLSLVYNATDSKWDVLDVKVEANSGSGLVEYANYSAFPTTGMSGLIYAAIDAGIIYRWSGSAYTEISPSIGFEPFDYQTNDYMLLSREVGSGVNTGNVSSNANNSNGGALYVPFTLHKATKTDRLAVNITTANAGASAVVRLGIYASISGRPTNVVTDSTPQSINTTGMKTCTFTEVTLPRGKYWAVLTVQGLDTAGANPAFYITAAATAVAPTTSLPTDNNLYPRWISVNGTFSGAFTSNPAILTNFSFAPAVPHIWFKITGLPND